MVRKRDEEWNGEENHHANERSCCCSCKMKACFALLVLIGGAAGALIHFVGFDELKSWVGLGDENASSSNIATIDSNTTDTNNTDAGDTSVSGPNACNGLQSNCGMKINDILFGSLHNGNSHDGPYKNHEASLEKALDAGYRALNIDVCKCTNTATSQIEIVFCHGICSVGRRDPVEVFENIATFLEENEREILIINFELSSGLGDTLVRPSSQELWDVIPNIGIKNRAYDHQGGGWPTLQNLLDDGKQLIMFKHLGPICNDGDDGCVNEIEEFHSYAVETKYDFVDVDEVENESVSCVADRGNDGTKDFYVINNFVSNSYGLPSKTLSETLNAKDFLEKRLRDCELTTNLQPNIINIDFWQVGDVLDVVRETNKARASQLQSV